jgi:hypothetical protein
MTCGCVQVWCLKVSKIGDFLITGSHDRSLRRWRRSTDPFFLEEEKEKRLERAFEANVHPASHRAAVVPGAEVQAAVESAAQPSKVLLACKSIVLRALTCGQNHSFCSEPLHIVAFRPCSCIHCLYTGCKLEYTSDVGFVSMLMHVLYVHSGCRRPRLLLNRYWRL